MTNYRKYLLIFSGLLLAYKYFGLVIKKVPFTDVLVESEQSAILILALLTVYFGTHYSWSWLRGKNRADSKFEFCSAILIALIALSSVLYDYLVTFGIDWKVLFIGLVILLFGLLPAICLYLTITAIFSIRSKAEMTKLGVGRIPSASKAFFFGGAVLLILSLLIFGLFFYFHQMLPDVLQRYWLAVFLTPSVLINLEDVANLFLLLGPSKLRENSLKRLKLSRRAMDIHEMYYQYIGIEKSLAYDIPEVSRYAYEGDVESLKSMLACGEDPNCQDSRGWSPLMYAAAENQPEIVDLLLDYGADPNISNYLGRTALMYAANYGLEEIVRKLLSHGAITNVTSYLIGSPPLSAASARGHLAVVKLLIQHDADFNYTDSDGKTALALAMESGHGETAKYLRRVMLENDDRSDNEKADFLTKTDWVEKR